MSDPATLAPGLSALDKAFLVGRSDPLKLAKILWPDVRFYNKQREVIYSVWQNDTTTVHAGHMLGKDFVTGFICLAFFLTRNPCKVITTSVDAAQLEGVLWGEIRRFIQTSAIPLEEDKGGPLIVNHMHVRKRYNSKIDAISTMIGRVAAQGEGLSGHHVAHQQDGIPRALAVIDEASGVEQTAFSKMGEWAHRMLIIGNPYDCNNQFRWDVEGKPGTDDKGGDIPRDGEQGGYHRKVIEITAEHSPNVDLALRELKMGRIPSNRIILPGVLPYPEYCKRLKTWDIVKQTVGLRARFYKGAGNLLYPPQWLDLSEQWATELQKTNPNRKARSIGIDSGEGAANTSIVVIDEHGIIERRSSKTPDTSVITDEVIAVGKHHQVDPCYWIFDSGGGGKAHAHRLRAMGYEGVRLVGFGEGLTPLPRRGSPKLDERRELRESRYVYVKRRAEMYGNLRNMLDPNAIDSFTNQPRVHPFAIPPWYPEIRQQLAAIPLLYDGEGRMYLPPKHRKGEIGYDVDNPAQTTAHRGGQKTLVELIGYSPDEADALVLAIWGMLNEPRRGKAGVAW